MMIDLEKSVLGTQLTSHDQKIVLAQFVDRYTRDHRPKWVSWSRTGLYRVQFSSDQEWLENTRFQVRADGRLDNRVRSCYSRPTWPDGRSDWNEIYEIARSLGYSYVDAYGIAMERGDQDV